MDKPFKMLTHLLFLYLEKILSQGKQSKIANSNSGIYRIALLSIRISKLVKLNMPFMYIRAFFILSDLNGIHNILTKNNVYKCPKKVFFIFSFTIYFSKTKRIKYHNPQIIKDQLAPCQKPVINQTIIILKTVLIVEHLFPPRGM